MWEIALGLAAIIVIYAAGRAIVLLIWPRKIQPHEYEDPQSWGAQDFDVRKPRRRK